jgi:hypothetical protein
LSGLTNAMRPGGAGIFKRLGVGVGDGACVGVGLGARVGVTAGVAVDLGVAGTLVAVGTTVEVTRVSRTVVGVADGDGAGASAEEQATEAANAAMITTFIRRARKVAITMPIHLSLRPAELPGFCRTRKRLALIVTARA